MKTLGMVILAAFAWSQTALSPTANDDIHYPQLIRAELPVYPPIARTAHITGTVKVQVVVEKGGVADAQVKSVVIVSTNGPGLTEEGQKKVGPILSNPSLANIKTWQFQAEDRTTFVVTYVYKIEGQETLLPENPKVVLDLPLVKITSRPFKPTCNDCVSQ